MTDEGAVRHAIGCMSGTSLDGLDAVLVRARGAGWSMRVEVLGSSSAELGPAGEDLRALCAGGAMTAREIASAAHDLGERHAALVSSLAGSFGVEPDLIAAHGQTVFHGAPVSWQLMQPWALASLGCPVVYDLRGADLAMGGEGAPITPAADWVMLRSEARDRVVVNLGGFCNTTVLVAGGGVEMVRGADVCACNHVLDACARAALGEAYDAGGATALRGRVDEEAEAALREALGRSTSDRRSLGTGDECTRWVGAWAGRLAGDDLLATAAAGVGGVIGERVRALRDGAEVVLAGGGARNAALVRAIEREAGATITTDALGVGVQEREGAAMAVLGLLAMDGADITLAAVTGRRDGGIRHGAWIGGVR
jgi:anhydro-N-acetylmuramic acid kinase